MSQTKDVLLGFADMEDRFHERIQKGIEENRKGTAGIFIKDKYGHPIPNAKIKFVQKSHEFKHGANIFMLDELENEIKNQQYKDAFKAAFNMATLPFYWRDVEPEEGQLRYDKNSKKIYRRPPIDLCMEFCQANEIEPREHALAYEDEFPDWLAGAETAVVKEKLERRYQEISQRYADKIPTIEVTNEMFKDTKKTDFYNDPNYVKWCFDLAARYFPDNQLVINEMCINWDKPRLRADPYYLLIENALLKGTRIDAVGLQFHMFFKAEEAAEKAGSYYSAAKQFNLLDTFADFQKPIQITEVTIPAYSREEDEEIQAEIIRNLYTIWFSHPNVEQIIYWNLVDGYAWAAPQGDMTSGENYYHGGLLRFDMSPKPAYHVIRELFQKTWHTECEAVTDCSGSASFRGFYGTYDVEITIDGRTTVSGISLLKKAEDHFEIVIA